MYSLGELVFMFAHQMTTSAEARRIRGKKGKRCKFRGQAFGLSEISRLEQRNLLLLFKVRIYSLSTALLPSNERQAAQEASALTWSHWLPCQPTSHWHLGK